MLRSLCLVLTAAASDIAAFQLQQSADLFPSRSSVGRAPRPYAVAFVPPVGRLRLSVEVQAAPKESAADDGATDLVPFGTEEEKARAVGNLVADDEWAGLTMELSDIIRRAVIEDIKANARDFLGKDNYEVGDLSKEIDTRVKGEVARLRNKQEYELGDFVLAMDEMSKNMTEVLTGKPYEAGDLSIELDKRIKKAVAGFCGAESYEFGMLSRTIAKRVDARVTELLGKSYEFGDISRMIENQRQEWVKTVLGEEAAANYKFGDLTRKFINNYTGKSEYKFGDLSKKLFSDLFNDKKD